MVHHSAGATTQVADLLIYNFHPQKDGSKRMPQKTSEYDNIGLRHITDLSILSSHTEMYLRIPQLRHSPSVL